MKVPYSPAALARTLKRVYPNERVEPDFGTVRLLRNVAFDDFTGNLVVTPYEYALLQSAARDARNAGYLKFSSDQAVAESALAFETPIGHELHVHYSSVAEEAYRLMAAASDHPMPICNGVYGIDPDGDNVTLIKSAGTRKLETSVVEAEFTADFQTSTGRLVKAGFFDGKDWRVADEAVLAVANDWAAPRMPQPRKVA